MTYRTIKYSKIQMAMTNNYQLASRQLLAQGQEELAKGDARQASEKGWGAAAQIVKAVAELRGWGHRGHGQLHSAVTRLRNETGDPDIHRLFQVANSLHVNFYENWQEAQSVSEALDDVETFLDKVGPLIRVS